MPSPKSVQAPSPDPPNPPDKPEEADVADPGKSAKKKEVESKKGKSDLDSHEIKSGGTEDESGGEDEKEEDESHWVGVELQDHEGNPIKGAQYTIVLPDGAKRCGRLDKAGKMKIENIFDEGDCKISFPEICGDEWKKK